MSRIAFLTEALRRAHPAPPRRSRAGSTPSAPEALDRREERLLLRVSDLHELALLPLDRNALQSLELADPVVAVHDRVAKLQVAQVRKEGFRGAPAGDGGPPLLPGALAVG